MLHHPDRHVAGPGPTRLGALRGSHRHPSQDHPGVPGVQEPQLHHPQEPAERPRPARADEVLPAGPQAHPAPRDPLTRVRSRAEGGSMALDRELVGRSYPPSAVYEVGRAKIAEFATAIGEDDPVHRDVEAARAAGHADVIAPPTFAIVVSLEAAFVVLGDPDVGLDYSRVVHGEQRFTHHRPIRAGDRLVATTTIDAARAVAG